MYNRRVQYYETDKMGIVHHSNYIRWMEEARVDWLREVGLSYKMLEEMGLPSPVLGVKCTYKKAFQFDEEFFVQCRIKAIGTVRFIIGYTFKNAAGDVTNEGESEHCFTNLQGKPLSIKKTDERIYKKLLELVEKE